MKLLLANYEYPPLGGGAGNATAYLARALRTLGHQVYVVTSGYGGEFGWSDDGGVELLRLRSRRRHVDRASLLEMSSYVLRALWAVPGLVRRHGIDGCVVFFSMPCGPIGMATRLVAGAPYVIALRGGDVPGAEPGLARLQRMLGPVRRAILRRARAVVANSRGLAAMSEKADPVAVDVIPNGVDTTFFHPPTSPAQRPDRMVRVLYAGRFQSQKNLFVLLQQFAAARARSIVPLQLTMVGDGPQRPALQLEAGRLGIADAVAWMGWLAKPALADLYRDADLFLNPSLYEGMPNTVLEAMASGLPVVASAVAGNDELVEDGRTGLLFGIDDPDALASAITRYADDAQFRSACGLAAREKAVRDYSWEAAARRYAAYFSQGTLQ